MTDLPPLTSAELADLKAKAKASQSVPSNILVIGRVRDYARAANPETILRLINMIERRDEQIEQIEKLRTQLSNIIGNVKFGSYESTNQALREAQEALAATEPQK